MATHFGEPSVEGGPTDTQASSSQPRKRMHQKSLNEDDKLFKINLRINSPLGQEWLLELQGLQQLVRFQQHLSTSIPHTRGLLGIIGPHRQRTPRKIHPHWHGNQIPL